MTNLPTVALFIDLDNTILEGPFESAVFPTIFREISRKSGLTEEEVRRLVVEENFRRQEDGETPAIMAMDWDDIIDKVASELDVNLDTSVLQIVQLHASPPYSVVLDEAREVLLQLSAPHRKLIAATKGLRKYQLPVLDSLDLTRLFTDILTPDSNNALKQERLFYGQWPEQTGLQISIGDHYRDDVVAPNRFGFKTVWKVSKKVKGIEDFDPFDRVKKFQYSENQTVWPSAIILALQELPRVITKIEKNQFNSTHGSPATHSG